MKEMFVYKMDVLKQVLQYCRKAIRRKPERRKNGNYDYGRNAEIP